MTDAPLEALLRLRRMAEDETRRGLAACLRAQAEADETVAAIDAAIRRETEFARELAAGDAEVEAFAAWLHRMRPRQQAARVAARQAEAHTVEARAAFGAARAAVKATELVLEKHAAARQAEQERRAQREIDEVAARKRTG